MWIFFLVWSPNVSEIVDAYSWTAKEDEKVGRREGCCEKEGEDPTKSNSHCLHIFGVVIDAQEIRLDREDGVGSFVWVDVFCSDFEEGMMGCTTFGLIIRTAL